ncbi:MAG: restriction endonuclease [Anaerolineales bacterium]|nr:restriction endonuclease [Anaerolineales bacterium]
MSLFEQKLNWLFNYRLRARRSRPKQPVSKSSLWSIGGLTAVYLIWLLYRWILQPVWLAALPTAVNELVQLMQVAGAFTLLILWVMLWWRQQSGQSLHAVPAISLDDLYEMSPTAFEKYVAQVFRRRGYRVGHRGRAGDLGVDLELSNGNGKRAIVQCKRYRNTIGPDIVRELYGTLIHEKVAHAFLVTTADISDAAREWARGKPMTLIDGKMLVQVVTAVEDDVGK